VGELVDGKQQEPGCQHEGGRQRGHVPRAQEVGQRHHDDGGDGPAKHDVDGQQRIEIEEEGQADTDQDAVEPEQAVADQRTVGAQQVSRKGAGRQTEQSGTAELGRVDEDTDKEEQPGEGIVLEHHLPGAAQQGIDAPDRWVGLRQPGPGVCCAPRRACCCHDSSGSHRWHGPLGRGRAVSCALPTSWLSCAWLGARSW
jgi:hypothetical protein